MLFSWKDEFSVGVESLDRQHRQLIALINDLYEAMQDGSGNAVIKPILMALKDYTQTHFVAEERFMDECGYPDHVQHRAEHGGMIAKIAELEGQHRAGASALSIQTLIYLRNWLETHICISDKNIALYKQSRKPVQPT